MTLPIKLTMTEEAIATLEMLLNELESLTIINDQRCARLHDELRVHVAMAGCFLPISLLN